MKPAPPVTRIISVAKGRPERLISPPGGSERSERGGTFHPSREGPPRATDQPPGGQRAERAWGDVSSAGEFSIRRPRHRRGNSRDTSRRSARGRLRATYAARTPWLARADRSRRTLRARRPAASDGDFELRAGRAA